MCICSALLIEMGHLGSPEKILETAAVRTGAHAAAAAGQNPASSRPGRHRTFTDEVRPLRTHPRLAGSALDLGFCGFWNLFFFKGGFSSTSFLCDERKERVAFHSDPTPSSKQQHSLDWTGAHREPGLRLATSTLHIQSSLGVEGSNPSAEPLTNAALKFLARPPSIHGFRAEFRQAQRRRRFSAHSIFVSPKQPHK